jgi:peptidoglycan/LPS O-acetylase OafA/YrhL
VGRTFNWAPFGRLGRISYSLYLWQQFFLARGGEGLSRLPFPANVAAAVGVAALSYHALEQPMLRVRDRVLRRMRAAQSGRTAALAPTGDG